MSDERFSAAACHDIAEKMGYNLGLAFTHLWLSGFDKCLENLKDALFYLERADKQTHPIPHVTGEAFREHMADRKMIFNRPSPWCESVRYAMAAICDMCSNPAIAESSRLSLRAIQCVKTAIDDENCLGRAMEA